MVSFVYMVTPCLSDPVNAHDIHSSKKDPLSRVGGARGWELRREGSVLRGGGRGTCQMQFFLSMMIENRFELPRLSVDFMYSEALFSIMRASSSSGTTSDVVGL